MEENKEVILVTGSCGLIGISVVKKLGEEFRIVGLELLKAFYASANEELVPCDLSSDESVQQALNHIRHFYGNRVTAVVHLAAYYSFSHPTSDLYNKVTVEGTRRLLRGLQSFHVERFIFSSTMLVHAPCQPGQKINEEWAIKPKWGYPLSKVQTEKVIQEERGSIPTIILRIAGVYTDNCHSVPLAHQIQRIYENSMDAHLFAGDKTHGADFMHINDLVEVIVKCVHLRNELPEELVLLIGEGKTLSYEYLQNRISTLLHDKNISTYSIPKPLAKLGAWIENHAPFNHQFIQPWMIDIADDHYELDLSKAKKFLNWTPKYSLDKTLPIIINALKHDPAAWYKKNGLYMKASIKKKIEEKRLGR